MHTYIYIYIAPNNTKTHQSLGQAPNRDCTSPPFPKQETSRYIVVLPGRSHLPASATPYEGPVSGKAGDNCEPHEDHANPTD